MRKFYYLNNTIGKTDVIPFDIISIISNEKYQFSIMQKILYYLNSIFSRLKNRFEYYLNNIKIPSMKI